MPRIEILLRPKTVPEAFPIKASGYSGEICGNRAERTERQRAYDEGRTRQARSVSVTASWVIAAKLFPDTNGAVDRLRAEVAARRCSEHQRDVRKSSFGSSRYANRERR